MAKGKGNTSRFTSIAAYVFLIAALGTYFLPIVSVTLPALGKKSWSVRDIVKSIPKGTSQKESQLTSDYDFLDLVKEIAPKQKGTQTPSQASPQFIAGALVPIALALAYIFVVLSLFLAPLKKGAAFVSVSVLSAVCSTYALIGTYYLGQAAQNAFSSSLAKIEGSPFSEITKKFVQEVAIRPETGLMVLVVLTVAVAALGFYRSTQASK